MAATKPFASCVKGLFMIFNFVLWISGLALLTVGVLAKYQFAPYMTLSSEINYELAPYIMIGCGVFIVLVGFCGCWASMKEHGWALKIYMGILVILFLAECGGAIAGYIMRNKLNDGLTLGMKTNMEKYASKDINAMSIIDNLQKTLIKCCGSSSYKDWAKYLKNNNTVPESCCDASVKKEDCHFNDLAKTPMGIYSEGCISKVVAIAKTNFMIIGGVALGIAVLQLLGVLCAFALTKIFNQAPYEEMA